VRCTTTITAARWVIVTGARWQSASDPFTLALAIHDRPRGRAAAAAFATDARQPVTAARCVGASRPGIGIVSVRSDRRRRLHGE
jgi:hypothetical protein